MAKIIGIDVGGSHISAGLFDKNRLVEQKSVPFGKINTKKQFASFSTLHFALYFLWTADLMFVLLREGMFCTSITLPLATGAGNPIPIFFTFLS